MSQPAPGWYPDPSDGTTMRFWDGQQWLAEQPGAEVDPYGNTALGQPQASYTLADPYQSDPQAQQASYPQDPAGYGQQPGYAQQVSYGQQTPYGQAPYEQPAQFAQVGPWPGAPGPQKKSNTGLILGLSALGIVAVIALLVIGLVVVNSGDDSTTVTGTTTGQDSAPVETATVGTTPLTLPFSFTRGGEYQVEVQVDTAGAYTIEAVSDVDDPFLTVESEAGRTWEDDDGGDFPNSLLRLTLDPGVYTITVTGYQNRGVDGDVIVTPTR